MKNKNKTTKFPVARIKRIMQKDEEVGKVAQATPIVISKALELFLAMIIDEANKVTAERGSRRVEAYHLKHAVETVDMLDFLKELVEGVPDPSAGGTIDLEAEAAESGRKRRSGKGKKPAEGADGDASATPARKRRRKSEAKEGGDSQPQGRRRGRKKDKEEHEDAEMDYEEEEGANDDAHGGMSGVVRRDDDDDDDWEG
ncbi:histone-fold-containing protein [Wolfiporia cocos MD-104 SS10]|uniref:Histone-fold-containing protein n=1 Tax=Wolfiporia cocos (strain MD-104) TaxID=742152 RepID=A0A2H3JFJ7_WOLCO|nr:histone-fold-containing protein [Wolfiporia cocos MD-104 SS10]